MTRKDYIVLAAALNRTKPDDDVIGEGEIDAGFFTGKAFVWRTTVRSVADALQADNPRFDRGRFYFAAGYVPETRATSVPFETV